MTLGHYKRHATSHALITTLKTPNENYMFRCSLSLLSCLQRGVLRKGKLLSEGMIVCGWISMWIYDFCYCLSYRVY